MYAYFAVHAKVSKSERRQNMNCLSVRLKIKLKYSLDSTIIIKSFLSVYLYFLRFSEQIYYLCIL